MVRSVATAAIFVALIALVSAPVAGPALGQGADGAYDPTGDLPTGPGGEERKRSARLSRHGV